MLLVRGEELYEAVRKFSDGSNRYWIASPYLGRDAHNIFSSTFHETRDARLLVDVKSGAVDHLQLERMRKWAGESNVRTLRNLHAKIYIFDRACIVTSANLSLRAFEYNHEIGNVITKASAMKAVRNFFTHLWKSGKTISPTHMKKLGQRKKAGGFGRGGADGVGRHTSVSKWDHSDQAALANEIPEGAGQTAELEGAMSDRLRERIFTQLASLGISERNIIQLACGVREGARQYQKGWLFDASYEFGTRSRTWKLGATREIGKVVNLVKVGSHAILVYKSVVKKYRVDSVIRKAAKRLHVYRGNPDSFQIRAYLQIVQRRKKLFPI